MLASLAGSLAGLVGLRALADLARWLAGFARSWPARSLDFHPFQLFVLVLSVMMAASPLFRSLNFSSVVALMGGAGQSNYSAANCCLDAHAAYRRVIGQVGTAVQWGAWAEVGMASGAKIGSRFEASGYFLIQLAQGSGKDRPVWL